MAVQSFSSARFLVNQVSLGDVSRTPSVIFLQDGRIATVRQLFWLQSEFPIRRSDGHKAVLADGIDRSISVMPVSKTGSGWKIHHISFQGRVAVCGIKRCYPHDAVDSYREEPQSGLIVVHFDQNFWSAGEIPALRLPDPRQSLNSASSLPAAAPPLFPAQPAR